MPLSSEAISFISSSLIIPAGISSNVFSTGPLVETSILSVCSFKSFPYKSSASTSSFGVSSSCTGFKRSDKSILSNSSSSAVYSELSSAFSVLLLSTLADFVSVSFSGFGSTSGVSASKLLFFGADKSISSILLSSFGAKTGAISSSSKILFVSLLYFL